MPVFSNVKNASGSRNSNGM